MLSSGELEDVVYIVSRNTVSNQLPIAAMQYDSTQLANYGVQYNDKALDVIMDAIVEQTNHKKN